ncbi:YncE family protein [Pseudomonas fluorescens]|uniref:YncE family protein n=1 Tax=Pseudomonas fluorescens TaxID=294 RepID=UPI00124089E1|nr:YncE family protein [Pseudomonas fluorescens]VVO60576.1 hypothetical protein PS898_00773 [Pseudomonas fluorescens]
MSTPQKPDNSTLVHKELDIPGRTGPVSLRPMVWGINRAAALDNFPRQGLLCRAGPWSLMGVGDKLTIIMGGDQVRQVTIDKDEVDKELQMFVPSARLTEGTHTISYTVTRLNQGAEPSEVMDVLVKLTRPGGHDETEGPGHSELIMSIPKDIIQGGIDKDNVAAGVPITIGNDDGLPPYPNAATGDQIQVSWGGVFVLSERLTHEQAEGKDKIIVHISEKTILEAEDSDQTGLAVAFEVYDLVDNRSSDWSFAQRVVVTTDATRLVAPLHEKAVNNVLDVKDLKGAHSNAQIVAFDLDTFKEGDIIILRLRCTPMEGAPIDIEITGEPLFNLPSVHLMPVPNALLRLMAQSLLAMSYRVKKADGSPDLRSKTRFISVIGELQRLAAPVALDAVSGALDPELATVRIKIPFDDSFAEGQAIQLYWLGTRPDLTPYLPDLLLRSITQGDVTAKQPLFMNIRGSEHLPPINGGQLELYYRVLIDDSVLGTMNRVNQTHAIRESIHAEILQIGEPRLELPEPKVDGVVDGILPPDTNGTTLTVEYTDTAIADVVTYHWFGTKTGEHSDSVTLSSFTAGRPISFNIDAKWIKGNEGGMVSASYSIIRKAGGTSYSNALEFHVGVTLELTAPDIREAIGDSLNPIAAKDTLTAIIPQYPGMLATDMISVTWTGTPGNGSHTTAAVAVDVVEAKEIELLNSVVAFNLGLTVTVNYIVTRNGMPKISDSLYLTVQKITESDLPLSTPVINDNTGSELDVTTLPAGAKTRIAGWPFIALRQRIWLRYFVEGDSTPIHTEYEGTEIPVAGVPGGMFPNTPLGKLKELTDGARLRIEFKVSFDGSSDESTAVIFPVRTYTVKAVEDLKPEINSIKGSPSGAEIPPNGTTEETAVILSGTAAKGQQIEVFDGITPKGRPVAHTTTGLWELAVNELSVGAHSFKAKALYGSGAESAVRTFTVADKLKITHIQDPQYMTVSPDGAFVHVGCYGEPYNTGNRSLNLINLAKQTITKSVAPGYVASAVLSPDGRRIYVCAGNIIEYDATDLTLKRTYTRKYHPLSLVLSPDNTRFYCVIFDGQSSITGKLEVIDVSGGQTIRTINLGMNTRKILINHDGSRLYVQNLNSIGSAQGGVGVIDTSTTRLIDVIDTGHNPSDMVASPDWEFLYVARAYTNELIEISTRTNKITRRIPTKLKISKLAITPDGKHLCGVGPDNNNEATIFDTNTLNARPIHAGRKPSAVAFSKDGQRVYICNFQDDNLWDFSWL